MTRLWRRKDHGSEPPVHLDSRQKIRKLEAPTLGTGSQSNVGDININFILARLDDAVLADQVVAELVPSLQQLLEKLPDARSLVYKVVGHQQIPPELTDADLRELLDKLNEYDPRGGIPLPLEVAELASRRARDPVLRHQLEAINDRWAAQAENGPSRLAAARARIQASEDPCLMIRLEREKNGERRYLLSACMFEGHDIISKHEGPGYLTLEENHKYLDMILPRLVRTVSRKKLSVEFVVDRELLNEEFDQWVVPENTPASVSHEIPGMPTDAEWYRIGVDYLVVVRDLRRMMDMSLHDGWAARWNALLAGVTCLRWVDPRCDVAHKLRASLLSKHQLACLVLVSAPCADSIAADLLATGLVVGAPVAVWLRASSGEEQARAHLETVLGSEEPRDLPGRIHALRREADASDESDNHHGHQLSLLWDDPNRIWEPAPPLIQP